MLVQLCTLPWLGFVPDDVGSAPPAAVARVAERLGVASAALRLYGKRDQTRSDHLILIAKPTPTSGILSSLPVRNFKSA